MLSPSPPPLSPPPQAPPPPPQAPLLPTSPAPSLAAPPEPSWQDVLASLVTPYDDAIGRLLGGVGADAAPPTLVGLRDCFVVGWGGELL